MVSGGPNHNSPQVKAGKHGLNLAGAVQMFPTPTARMHKDNGKSPSELNRNSETLATKAGGQLNPQWVEWLMGFPIGWTDLEDSETQ
jgi:DNA (cytosine-5)-methyltransferase 1